MDQSNMPMGVKFAVIHRAFRREMDALLREKDVTGAQFGALRALDYLERERGGEISQHDLEEISRSTHPTMTEILKKLEKKLLLPFVKNIFQSQPFANQQLMLSFLK